MSTPEPLTHAELSALCRMVHADVPRHQIPDDVAASLIRKKLAIPATLSAFLPDRRVTSGVLRITAAGKSALRRE